VEPPPPPPPPPSASPPVSVQVIVSGDPSDYDATKKAAVECAMARVAEVECGAVTVTVTAASVLLDFIIVTSNPAATKATVKTALATTAGASTALAVTVERVPTVAVMSGTGGASKTTKPSIAASGDSNSSSIGPIIGGVVGGLLALCCCCIGIGGGVFVCMKQKKAAASAGGSQAQGGVTLTAPNQSTTTAQIQLHITGSQPGAPTDPVPSPAKVQVVLSSTEGKSAAPLATKIVELVRTPLGLGLSVDSQYKVVAIAHGSQAQRNGSFAVHDQLVSLNGQPLSGGVSFEAQLGVIAMGTKITIEIELRVHKL